MLGNKTPITYVTPGYKPDLDRLPPQGAGCNRGCVWLLVIMMLGIWGVGAFFVFTLRNQPESPAIASNSISEPQSLPTATATMDYCWFLTPTIEALPTIQVTLDTWQIKATDDSFLTGTPTPTVQPTTEPPRPWCNDILTMESQPTATWTPYGFPSEIPRLDFEPTATITDTPQSMNTLIPTSVPRSTLFPTPIPRGANTAQQPVQQAPVVVIQTVVVVETVVEKVKVKDKVTVIVTTTPTATLMPEVTEEPTIPTDTPTIEPTLIPSVTLEATLMPTLTNTPTETATFTPTATYTHTPTVTNTATLIPTSTLFPTFIPTATQPPTETATETDDNA